ncbi:SRPBCC domain-containing protein [Dyadobacter sp. CY327]|uniref:SRPBCC domain-containing protein n=1 Tax=Dyadobacter sp. CY327 TaxID=2907301 RepID=UPI001F27FA0D|nr:SRPBCC domain-containing protein [Dyadobacter sp. CY327]MCE7072181.1 SRPBCC domain-containing protein [Dyadobacter sp. CY327]
MDQPLFVTNSITINAPAPTVWDALVNPEKTKQYMFGCAAISTWQPGDELLWKGVADGQEVVYVKGNVISIDPGKRLEYTTFDPNDASMEDVAENHLHVIYELREENGQTVLTASQGDFATVARGKERYEEVFNGCLGWTPMLEKIKAMLES